MSMSSHPLRNSADEQRRNPLPSEVKAAREQAGLTQTEAGELVHAKCRAWQQWEAGDRRMHPAFWELFRNKVSLIEKGPDMTTHQTSARREAPAVPAPLTPDQRATYAATIKQTEAIFALEDMAPNAQDLAIDAAILAGKVSPEQAREELLAYVIQHKTVRGFIESRAWAA